MFSTVKPIVNNIPASNVSPVPTTNVASNVLKHEQTGAEAASVAAKKGIQAAGNIVGDTVKTTGDVIGGAAQHVTKLVGDHPLAGGIAAGIAGTLAARKLKPKA